MAYARAHVFQDGPRRELQRVFDSLFAAGRRTGGPSTPVAAYEFALDFPTDVHLVGIDISAEALAKNENVDERILGDIQTYPLPVGSFDAVLCWWVLEHVRRPEAALRNMARSLSPGGLLVLSVPRLWSIKGIEGARLTPHRFHIWAYRNLLGMAGRRYTREWGRTQHTCNATSLPGGCWRSRLRSDWGRFTCVATATCQ